MFSPTANNLARAIDASGLSHREIADRAGFSHVNVLTMIKQGLTRVPLYAIPALAQTLGMDEQEFLNIAIQEYHPGVSEVLMDALGIPQADAEVGILLMFRMAALRDYIEVQGPFRQVLSGLLDLTGDSLARGGRKKS